MSVARESGAQQCYIVPVSQVYCTERPRLFTTLWPWRGAVRLRQSRSVFHSAASCVVQPTEHVNTHTHTLRYGTGLNLIHQLFTGDVTDARARRRALSFTRPNVRSTVSSCFRKPTTYPASGPHHQHSHTSTHPWSDLPLGTHRSRASVSA